MSRTVPAIVSFAILIVVQTAFAASGTITTVVGIGPPPPQSSVAPKPTAVLLRGNDLYISDEARNQVLRYDLTAEVLSVVAGTGGAGTSGDGGPATKATLDHPSQLAFDAAGNLYIADGFCDRIRKVTPSGIITTVAGSGTTCGFKSGGPYSGDGGPATSASLLAPHGIAVDDGGNLFIADAYNHRIRRVDAVTGTITNFAGTGNSGFCCNGNFSGDGGPASAAELYQPFRLTFDAGHLYFSDSYNQRIRRIDAVTGVITTIAGVGTSGSCAGYGGDGGQATDARFCHPAGLTHDSDGNLFVADYCNSRIRRVDAVSGVITTVAGAGATGSFGHCVGGPADDTPGPATSRSLQNPNDVEVDENGNLYIADYNNSRIRKVDPAGIMTTLLVLTPPAGTPALDQLSSPSDVAVDPAGNRFVADTNNHRVLRVSPSGVLSQVVGTGVPGYTGDGASAAAAKLDSPRGLVLDGSGNLYIADSGNHVVRRVTPGGLITTFAGSGTAGATDGVTATEGRLNAPRGLAWDGFNLYIADTGNNLIRRVDRYGVIMTFAGTGSPGYAGDGGQARMARLRSPSDVSVLTVGSDVTVYIADTGNHRIRRVDPFRTITTAAGTGQAGSDGDGGPANLARIHSPTSVWVDGSGLWLADSLGFRVRKVSGPLGLITTVAGSGQPGFAGDGGPALSARILEVRGIALGPSGDLYLADTGNHRLRKVDG